MHLVLEPPVEVVELDLEPLLRGHVVLRAEVVADLAAVPDGADVERVPEGGAILAVVEDVDRDVLARIDGAADRLDRLLVRIRVASKAAANTPPA